MLKCSQMFSDSMVLQREKCIAVWGTGEETWQNSDFGGIYDVMLTK